MVERGRGRSGGVGRKRQRVPSGLTASPRASDPIAHVVAVVVAGVAAWSGLCAPWCTGGVLDTAFGIGVPSGTVVAALWRLAFPVASGRDPSRGTRGPGRTPMRPRPVRPVSGGGEAVARRAKAGRRADRESSRAAPAIGRAAAESRDDSEGAGSREGMIEPSMWPLPFEAAGRPRDAD